MSPSFCAIKWKHATLSLATATIKTCCHNPFRKLDREQVKRGLPLNEDPQDNQVRAELLAGKKPKSCDYCWWMENSGHYSDRLYWSDWASMAGAIEEIKETRSEKPLSPSWLELSFSSACNLKCSYCNPGVSSSWKKEMQQFGAYPTLEPHNDLNWFHETGTLGVEEIDDALKGIFWDWFHEVKSGIRLLTLTGGEPLLSTQTFKLLDTLAQEFNPDLEIAINCNLCLKDDIWNRFIQITQKLLTEKRIKVLHLHPSLDAWGSRAEYIRNGLNMELFQKNLRSFLDNTQANVIVNCTLNNLSLTSLKEYWKFIISLKNEFGSDRWISSTTEILIHPQWQRINTLPAEYEHYLTETLQLMESSSLCSPHEISGMRRAIDTFKTPIAEPELLRHRKNFHLFFKEHDHRRSTDFLKTFPEMKAFWNFCEQIEIPQEKSDVLPT